MVSKGTVDRAKFVANFLLNDFKGILNSTQTTVEDNPIKPEEMMLVLDSMRSGEITRSIARSILKAVILMRSGYHG